MRSSLAWKQKAGDERGVGFVVTFRALMELDQGRLPQVEANLGVLMRAVVSFGFRAVTGRAPGVCGRSR